MEKKEQRRRRNKKAEPARESKKERFEDDQNPKGSTDRLSSLNDFSWYARYPQLIEAAGRIPYPYRPGMNMRLGSNPGNVNSDLTMNVPGIAAMRWVPSVGKSNVSTDPASLVGKETYARVRAAFSGTLRADAPDYVVYFVCLDSIFSYIGTLKRIWRQINAYSPDNYLLPEALLQAEGVKAGDIIYLQRDKKMLFEYINLLIHMARKFHCPAVFDYFNRHYWMNDNVYCDSMSINGQMYVFVQGGYYAYENVNTPDGVPAAGATISVPGWLTTAQGSNIVDNMYNHGVALINLLDAWDESYTISGYLSRAFEGSPDFYVDLLDYNEQFVPVYQPEVLGQIENSRALPHTSALVGGWGTSLTISQDPKTNSILCNPHVTVPVSEEDYAADLCFARTGFTFEPIINSREDTPTLENTVVNSRLMAMPVNVKYTSESKTLDYDVLAGTEIPTSWSIFYLLPDKKVTSLIYRQFLVYDRSATPTSYGGSAMLAAIISSNFDWMPLATAYIRYSTGGYTAQLLGDLHNVTALSLSDLENLHRICLYSEFNAFSISR